MKAERSGEREKRRETDLGQKGQKLSTDHPRGQ